jgi:hypothetical protein
LCMPTSLSEYQTRKSLSCSGVGPLTAEARDAGAPLAAFSPLAVLVTVLIR